MTTDHSKISLPIEGSDGDIANAMREYVARYMDEFPEWYMPLQLGDIVSIPARTYPTFQPRPESFLDETSGKRKWDLTLSKVMPDLTGKTICDIGCNIGIFSLEMTRLGAKRVAGFDRGVDIVQPNNHHLGTQSVAMQAYFVRNLYEAFYRKRYPDVDFFEQDLMTMDFKVQHRYDVFMACCVLYHLGYDRMDEIIRDISVHTPEVILQANDGHGGGLGQLSSLASHISVLEKYGYEIRATAHGPTGYPHPVVYASKDI